MPTARANIWASAGLRCRDSEDVAPLPEREGSGEARVYALQRLKQAVKRKAADEASSLVCRYALP